MDRLESMALLVAVADCGSLSAAGRRLRIPLATVSRRISDLEAHLKTQLLQRTSRKVALTDAGQLYLDACRRILEQVDAAERQASGEYSTPKGELVITAAMVFGRRYVTPIITDFLAAYPEIDVRMVMSDSVLNLLEGQADVGLRLGPLADSNLRAIRLGSIHRVICASPAYLAARGTPRLPRDLVGHDCITFIGPTRADMWEFPAGKGREEVRVRSRLVLNGAEAAVDAAIAGGGILAIFSYHVADAVREGKLVALPLYAQQVDIPVNLIHATTGLLPLKMRAFLDYAAPRLKAKLAEDKLTAT